MPKPTLTNVYDAARAAIADDDGDVYTDARLAAHFKTAYRQVFRVMQGVGNPMVETDAYFNLPANTGVLNPATAGISDMGEIVEIRQRRPTSTLDITNVTLSSNVATVTTAAHGRANGDEVVIYKVGGITGANGLWQVTVGSSTTVSLNGSYLTGTYTAATGKMSHSNEQWSDPLNKVSRIDEAYLTAPSSAPPRVYAWVGDVIRFAPSSGERQLWIVYRMSGTPPTTGSDVIQFDDSQDLLGYATAGYAGMTRSPQVARNLLAIAFGPNYLVDNRIGGMLYDMMQVSVKALNNQRHRRPPFGGRPYWLEDRTVSS